MDNEIREILNPIIGDIDQEIIEYMVTITQEDDLVEFLSSVVDTTNSEHVRALNKLKALIIGKKTAVSNVQSTNIYSKTATRKQESDKTLMQDIQPRNLDEKSKIVETKTKQENKKKERKNRKNNNSDFKPSLLPEENNFNKGVENLNGSASTASNVKSGNEASSSKSRKANYVNFDAYTSTPGLKKGRHPCNCEAKIHALINNCLKCGRIVCEQEGSGPCFFCDNMVGTQEEMEILNSNSKESNRLYNKLMDQKKSKEWKKAIELRNRLVSTDKMGDIKNKVYDDQMDYFSMNSPWLSGEERAKLKQAHDAKYNVSRSKMPMKLALDLASRTVTTEQDDDFTKNKGKLLNSINKLLDANEKRFPKNLFEGESQEFYKELTKAIEENSGPSQVLRGKENQKNATETGTFKRVANTEFLQSIDQGMCLTMHQPWASLLVAGIKIHEGRTWRTDHRGRLWIHAASKQPSDETILDCEEFYRKIYDDPTMQFPRKYPTSCLLGCVFVEDCLPQKEYREQYLDGESDSPYVLICSNPTILPVFIPMSGQHKIFQLSKEIHRQAKEALMASTWV